MAGEPGTAGEDAMANARAVAEMRAASVRGLLIYCQCSQWTAISGDQWPDDVRLSDLEARFTCLTCGRRGAEVRPDWQSAEAVCLKPSHCLRSHP